ncbi:THAP-type domain-containing protein [Trichonephila clavipes]|uniref:THAP-type domain-containing protein n=1 Tax=Trichonephila clavipes TaxID=2585209 RepID=A0A8X6W115_TRICX|nr:THAP-type domain-containing protein [Trichonephila clavipes]
MIVNQCMPPAFRMHFKDVRIIVDCTEFTIQKLSRPKEQQMTFSFYKNANTLKEMIGITPNGAISFISELYCGSISDKRLFIKSKLMDLLEPNDVFMADKGFLIENELASVGCKLQCPAFLRDKIQFDVSEMVSNCRTIDTGGLPYEIIFVVNKSYIIAANIDVTDGLANEIVSKLSLVELDDQNRVLRVWLLFPKGVRVKARGKMAGCANAKGIGREMVPINRRPATLRLNRNRSIHAKRNHFPSKPVCSLIIHKSQG